MGRTLAQNVAALLKTKMAPDSLENVAFLEDQGTVYYARHLADGGEPASATVRLIQAIYESYPEHARRLVRSRIFSFGRLTEMCHGMVKVAAKRATELSNLHAMSSSDGFAAGTTAEREFEFRDLTDISEQVLRNPSRLLREHSFQYPKLDWMKHAIELAAMVPRNQVIYKNDRPVASLLVSEKGELLAATTNTNAKNRTLHAELNIVQGYWALTGKRIPAGAAIYTTLKPCKMCAAMIWHTAEDRSRLRVFFHENDPGPMGRATVLDLGTHERQRASCNGAELALDIQIQISSHKCGH